MQSIPSVRSILTGMLLCAVFIVFYSCSNLIEKIGSGGDGPAAPTAVEVVSGYIDSAEARKTPDQNRYDDFVLRFPVTDSVGTYAIRVSQNPLTADNWSSAAKVSYSVLHPDSNGYMYVSLHLQPVIDWNACTGCGDCVKPRTVEAIHRPWYYPGTKQIYTNAETRSENPDPLVCVRNAISIVDGKARIDAAKCTACGSCFKSCNFKAISDCSYGRYYYFGVKRTNGAEESAVPVVSLEKFKIMYENWIWKDPAKPLNILNKICDKCAFAGCHANHAGHSAGLDRDSCEADPGNGFFAGCPVGALYANSDTSATNAELGAIYLDPEKCISCGICFERCLAFGRHSIMRKVVAGQ